MEEKSVLIHRASGLPSDTDALSGNDITALQPVFEKIKNRMDDWPQLNYYRHANAEFFKESFNENPIIFLGDSITEFWLQPKYGGFFPGKHYVNRGISAQTTPQMLLRLRADVIGLKPKAIVFLGGINDIAGNTGPMTREQTQNNIATISEIATLHKIKMIIASILPTSNYHYDGTDPIGPQTVRRPLEKIRALNDWIKSYCIEHNHYYLDYFSAMVDSSGMLKVELSDDDLHPNAAGYAIMAPLAEAAIRKSLT